jgi:hypothetical protein
MGKSLVKIKTTSETEGTVSADPTKRFFVTMLTRDIELMDAIMDLIDNCIDGVHRQRKNQKNAEKDEFKYRGYHADINITSNEFTLKDNCGGIPLEVAKNYAFKMGRSDDYHDDDNLETLGMYGIGMKRAIFKIGERAEVISWHDINRFKVVIPENWVRAPGWIFHYSLLTKSDIKGLLNEPGTVVKITKLHPSIKRQFSDTSGFIKNLQIALNSHYGYIIQQGFRINLNGVKILPIQLNIITTDPKDKKLKAIKPYVYTSKVDDVEIEIIIGFYRPPPTEKEIQQELEGEFAKSQTENAGITVLCNDRVVLYCDKSYITGWGEAPVPKYHTQFIAIAGVVHFRTNIPIKLPVTTTKRNLDTSSAVYAATRGKIKDGLKAFTAFTNNWKTSSEERAKLFESPKKINALKPGQSKSNLVTLTKGTRGDNSQYQIPDLPKPETTMKVGLVNISFSREKDSIDEIRNNFLSGKNKSANEVGAWCFDKILSQVE